VSVLNQIILLKDVQDQALSTENKNFKNFKHQRDEFEKKIATLENQILNWELELNPLKKIQRTETIWMWGNRVLNWERIPGELFIPPEIGNKYELKCTTWNAYLKPRGLTSKNTVVFDMIPYLLAFGSTTLPVHASVVRWMIGVWIEYSGELFFENKISPLTAQINQAKENLANLQKQLASCKQNVMSSESKLANYKSKRTELESHQKLLEPTMFVVGSVQEVAEVIDKVLKL